MRNQTTTNQTQKTTTTRPARAVLCLLLALLMLGGTWTAYAAIDDPPVITPYYVNIVKHGENFAISGIKATCKASLQTGKSMKLTIKMELQKLKSGTYETIKTWTSSKTGTTLTMSESRNINIFCDYRLKVTYTAGSETVVAYRYPA